MIGVQREVTGYRREGGWRALLVCGHSAQLQLRDPETFYPPKHPHGRHMDCPTCTAARDASQPASATSTPKETL